MTKRNNKMTILIILLILIIISGYAISPIIMGKFNKYKTCSQLSRPVTVTAHRGGANLAPENTLTAFKAGIEAGADMIELDIHMTKDGHILVCHDETVDRTTNGKGRINEMTLAEIKKLKVKTHEGKVINEHLPTLAEVFSLVKHSRANGYKCGMLIEVKGMNDLYQGIEEELAKMIEQQDARKWAVVQSFDDKALEHMYRIDKRLRLEKLVAMKFPGLPIICDGFHLSSFSFDKYHYISSFNCYHGAISRSFVDEVHAHGKEVKVWTINDGKAPDVNMDGVITNSPDLW